MIAPIASALTSQQSISKSHLLNGFFEALYSASLHSSRCVRSSGVLSAVEESVVVSERS